MDNKVEITFEIDEYLWNQVLKLCDELGITPDEFVEHALREYINMYTGEVLE